MATLSKVKRGQTVTEQVDLINSNVESVNEELVQLHSDVTNNVAGYITSEEAPVQSVNGSTGAVSLSANNVGAFPNSTTVQVLDINNTKSTGVYIGTDNETPVYLLVIKYSDNNIYQELIGSNFKKYRRFTTSWSDWIEYYSNEKPITASDVTGINTYDSNTVLDVALLNNGTFVKTNLKYNASTGSLWFGTSEFATKGYVDTAVNMIHSIIVNELPVTGVENTIYYVPDTTPETGNAYLEYVYVNGAWELVGATEVDLTPFLTKDEASQTYATKTENDGKVSKTTTVNGKALSSNITLTASDVGALPSNTPIPADLVHRYDNSTIASMLSGGDFTEGDLLIVTDTGTYLKGHIYLFTNNALTDITDIPNDYVDLTSDQSIAGIKNFTGLLRYGGVTVATSDDISTTQGMIPTVNDSTITLQENGVVVDTFTLNQSSGKTINIPIPTKTSDFTNDGDGLSYQEYSGYTEFDSTSDYVGYYVLVSTTYTEVTSANKDTLNIVAGTTKAYEYSPFATKQYVADNGGKIDTISVNGTPQTISNKNVDITVPTNTNQLTNGAGFVTSTDLNAKLDKVTSTSSAPRVYSVMTDGTQSTTTYSAEVGSNYIVSRNTGGQIKVPTSPTQNEHATSKQYVDTNITAITGTSAPTTSTIASHVGQIYLDTTNNKTYECIAITTESDITTYTWVQLIRATDLPGDDTYGVIRRTSTYGTNIVDGTVQVLQCTEAEITARAQKYKPVTPYRLNYAVKSALSDSNHLTMTSAEQAVAKSVLGITDTTLHMEVVASLDTASSTTWFDNSHTIYLAPSSNSSTGNIYDEYITLRSGTEGDYTYSWEKIGSTDIDLSGYVPTSRTVNSKALSSDITLSASDVSALSSSTKYGASLGVSGTSVQLKDQDGNNLGSAITTQDTGATSVETTGAGNVVSSASYDSTTRKLTLTKGVTALTSHQDISGKLDKVSTANTVYGVDGSGNQTNYSVANASNVGNAVAKYDSSGRLKAYTPSATDDVANKNYVDGLVDIHISLSGDSGTLDSTTLAKVVASPERVVINNTYTYYNSSSTNLYYQVINKSTNSRLFYYIINITKSSGSWTKTSETFYGNQVTVTTTSGSQSVSDGTNTLSFGSNAFNSTTIPTSVNGLSGGTISSTTTINGDMIANYVAVQSASHETTNTFDKYLTLSTTNYVRYRTKAEMKSDLGVPSIWSGTQQQYDAIQNKDSNTYYFIEEE